MFTLTQYLGIYLTTIVIFVCGDLTWLGFIAKDLYRKHIGHLLSDTVVWPVAIGFYLLFALGLLIFAIVPALETRSVFHATLYGALFGFFTYTTYDLTNWSTLRDWHALISVIDIVWGTILGCAVSTLTFWIAVTYILR